MKINDIVVAKKRPLCTMHSTLNTVIAKQIATIVKIDNNCTDNFPYFVKFQDGDHLWIRKLDIIIKLKG